MDLNAIQHLPPMLLSTWISEKMMAATIQDALDIQIWMLAKEWGLVVQGLESAEEQQIIYAGIPLSFQIRQLKKMLLNLSATGKNLTRIEQAYLRDDLLVLFRLTHRHLGKTKKILLYDRNLVMAQRIFDQIHNRPESSFFAIGAAHLPGQKGVLRYLKHHGLSLVPTVADAEINRI